MDISFQRRVDRIIGPILCGMFSLFPKRRREIPPPSELRKVMVILLSEMGSLVLAKPMFDHFRKRHPHLSVYVLLFEKNREILEILDVVPPENILTIDNGSLKRFAIDSIHFSIRSRQLGIDIVLDCELFSRISSLYSFLSGASVKIGFHPYTQEGLYRGNLINRAVLYNPYIHISQQFITLVDALDSDGIPLAKRKIPAIPLEIPRLPIPKDEIQRAMVRFQRDFPGLSGKKLILIHPGGGLLPIRAWPVKYYSRLVKDFLRRGYTVGITGIEEDKPLANSILYYCGGRNCVDLTGYTKSLRQLLVIFHYGSLLITSDGGPGHFAAMTPIPTIVLYGPETPILYGTLSPLAHHFHMRLSCSPCLTAYNHRKSPCDGHNKCLKDILPEMVLRKAYEILGDEG